ncbi:membrane protein [Tsukamurella pulmonis]|uniref:DUF4233 domain-containing protein n=1 Tax=Tsukamurella pulmonis TaxID=47312 RepID=A0A1H1DME5_9ACTN|nr:DUF4233 domain-containing protein [Tsukamurella pulmonis]KXO92298.1 hypothetical protein AXK56_04255 [Tsukamurella pulmonis]KXP09941.1 hypothetical protein AXK57_14060 [Tsukamurella pulmonis]RDH13865.1 DUF4233 domain-containing protein [Tsukamurella pulmonis]SDQ77036.1 Protein of unknown function [Tsukamurella pulmonis]SUP21959.1 Uncharacterised protein [Tsukamurella pulmonis]
MTGTPASNPRFTPPPKDPWKSFRGILSGTLILEMIVILLALPVVIRLSPGLSGLKVGYVLVLAALMFAGCMVVKKPWAIPAFCALQVAVIAGFLVHWGIGAVGVVFAIVWAYIVYIERDVKQRMAEGRLPGQEPITD